MVLSTEMAILEETQHSFHLWSHNYSENANSTVMLIVFSWELLGYQQLPQSSLNI